MKWKGLALGLVIAFSTATLATSDAGTSLPDDSSRPPFGMKNAADSVDQLLDQFLVAIEKRDKEALHRLRVTREEYHDIIIPGTVPPGQPPREIRDEAREFYWKLLDTKARYFADVLFERFGGRHFVDRDLRFSEPTQEYAWYRAIGEVRMKASADDQQVYDLRTGFIAEVDGKYKFISFEWED
jgi:hypothetical protein